MNHLLRAVALTSLLALSASASPAPEPPAEAHGVSFESVEDAYNNAYVLAEERCGSSVEVLTERDTVADGRYSAWITYVCIEIPGC